MASIFFELEQIGKTNSYKSLHKAAKNSALREYEGEYDPYAGDISTTRGVKEYTGKHPKYGSKAFKAWALEYALNNCDKWGRCFCLPIPECKMQKLRKDKTKSPYFVKNRDKLVGYYFFGIAAI